jgi:hypothetical protein
MIKIMKIILNFIVAKIKIILKYLLVLCMFSDKHSIFSSVAHPASYPMGTGGPSPEGKAAGA